VRHWVTVGLLAMLLPCSALAQAPDSGSPQGTASAPAADQAESSGSSGQAGYTFVADSTGGQAFTVVGGQNFIGGNGNLTVWNTVRAASVGGGINSIAAGDGNDLFGVVPGSTYAVAAGNGNDTFFGNGSSTMAGGIGSNLFFADPAGGSNLILSYGQDTVVANQGAVTVATYGTVPLIYGGSGSLEVFGNSATSETVAGGSGSASIFGAKSGVYFLGDSTSLFVGDPFSASTIVGSTGSETVFGGDSANELVFDNSSSLTFVAGTGNSATIIGGSSASTLFGSAGSAITYFATSSTAGALYAAGSRNETLNAAAGSPASKSIFGGADPTAGNSLVGGAGDDTFTAGTGSDTMVGGTGGNDFVFSFGQAGGNDFIVGFNLSDMVRFLGYGTAAVATALAAATVAGGNATIALSDNTKITFEDISTPKLIHFLAT